MGNQKLQQEYIFVEHPTLVQLKKQGWTTLELEMFGQDPKDSYRTSFDEIVIKSELIAAIKDINKDEKGRCFITDDQLDDLIQPLLNPEKKSLLAVNEQITKTFIQSYPTIDKSEINNQEGRPVKLIDFENVKKNRFLAISQYQVRTSDGHFIFPDITLFVNGIPLAVIECKHAKSIDSDPIYTGIEDLRMYQEIGENLDESIKRGNEKLFWYNQILISCDKDSAQYGTIGAFAEHFNEWKTIHPEETPYKTSDKQTLREQLIQGMLTPKNFLDIIYHFNIFMDIELTSGDTLRVKSLCRYQQFRAVSKAIDRLKTKKHKEDRGGIIWHTQGSGKSLTMVFLVKKIRSESDLKKLKVVMVTDRKDLDRQLGETAALTGEKPVLVNKVSEISEKLGNDTNNIVMAMIQKFLDKDSEEEDDDVSDYEENDEKEDYPVINESEDVLILVDEAHRTHNSSLGVRLNCAFPNAVKIAFTGTPLITERHKKKTVDTFGDYIDKYKFNEAIDDGATLAILYEGKTVKGQRINREGFDEEFEDMFAAKSPEEIDRIKKKYGTTGDILESEKRIKLISKSIVAHYVQNILPNGFKAQVVASSRMAAYRYSLALNEELQNYLKEHESDEDLSPKTKERLKIAKTILVVSGKGQEAEKRFQKLSPTDKTRINKENDLIESVRKESQKISLKTSFKKGFDPNKPETGICFLCVKDMLLTGFDAPIEQVMYIDKKMVEHNLLQAIARVNRKNKGKTRGYVVDYYGVVNHLHEALKIYADDDRKDVTKTFVDRTDEIPILARRYQAIITIFNEGKIKDFQDYVEGKVKDADNIKKIHDACTDYLRSPDTRGKFEIAYREFLESLDILMPDRACAPYLKPATKIGQILVDAKRIYERKTLTAITGAGEKIKHLINKYFEAEGVGTVIEPFEITEKDKFKDEVKKAGNPRTQATAMKNALDLFIQKNMSKDPARFEKLSQKLQEILKRLEENWEEQVKEFENLMDEMTKDRTSTILDPTKDRFLDLFMKRVEENIAKDEQQKFEKYVSIIDVAVDLISKEVKRIKDFWGPAHSGTRTELEAKIQDLFLEECPEIFEHKEKITKELLQLAKEVF